MYFLAIGEGEDYLWSGPLGLQVWRHVTFYMMII